MSEQEKRELDAWLAEHAMGYRWVNTGTNRLLPAEHARIALLDRRAVEDRNSEDEDRISVPHFSSDAAASKQLEDALVKRVLGIHIYRRSDGTTWCWIHSGDDETPLNEVSATSAETKELAVALEAKRAIEGDK